MIRKRYHHNIKNDIGLLRIPRFHFDSPSVPVYLSLDNKPINQSNKQKTLTPLLHITRHVCMRVWNQCVASCEWRVARLVAGLIGYA